MIATFFQASGPEVDLAPFVFGFLVLLYLADMTLLWMSVHLYGISGPKIQSLDGVPRDARKRILYAIGYMVVTLGMMRFAAASIYKTSAALFSFGEPYFTTWSALGVLVLLICWATVLYRKDVIVPGGLASLSACILVGLILPYYTFF